MNEARLEDSGSGLAPSGEGWFVLNVRDAEWVTSDTFGSGCVFESRGASFPQVGINISVLEPGEPNCLYHAESQQEAFLVVSGECKLLVEGEERLLHTWDFVHCPAGTEHVFVGAGDGPCAILMVVRGPRTRSSSTRFPSSPDGTERAPRRKRRIRSRHMRGSSGHGRGSPRTGAGFPGPSRGVTIR